jgi:PAS domain S-box-containing protein
MRKAVTPMLRKLEIEQNSRLVLDSVLNSIGSGVVVADLDGKFLLFNPAAERMLGIGATKTLPSQWSEIYGVYAADGVTQLAEEELPFVRAMKGESADSVRIFLRNANMAKGIWASFNIRPLIDEDGALQGGVVVFEDITKQIHLEQELVRSNQDLQLFASVAAHDLQEPLRTITSFLELFARRNESVLDDKSVHYMKFVHDGVRRMQTLINDLLTYARVQSQAKPFETVDCNEVVAHVIENLHSSVEQAGATVEVASLPVIRADKAQLAQVFQNLISNALKFKGANPLSIEIGAKKMGAHWQFSVKDTSIGIAADYHERIFGLFQRLHSIDKYPGSGIGLAVCKRIVERHNGAITIESTVGEGSTFYFTIGT